MRSTFIMLAMVGVLMLSAADVYAMAWGGGRGRNGGSSNSSNGSYSGGASVPEPSTLYAVSSGLALLAGAGWYIRRRK